MTKKEKLTKEQKKAANLAAQQMAKMLPYENVFEEEGIFEGSPHVYSKAYVIEDFSPDSIQSYNAELIAKRFGMLLNDLPDNVSMQFIIHNRLISQEVFLKKILMIPNKEPEVNKWIDRYNESLTENSTIGHNNMKKNKYFIISVKTDLPEDAVNLFRAEDEHIKTLFKGIMDTKVNGLTSIGRLRVMYSMLNPKRNDFGKMVDFRGDGNFTLKDIKKMKMTTKEAIAPLAFDTSNKNYIVLNGDTYVRSFFIVSLPVSISSNLISDITNISSNMVFSCLYEPVDSNFGFDVATDKVSKNTVIHQSSKRDTIRDRKEKTIIKTEALVNQCEDAYFERSALKTLQESVALGAKAMLCTFVVVLYADDLETLDRDTKLLHISTSKFACQVKSLDLQQLEGLQSALPLCENHIDAKRLLPIEKLSSVPPLNIQEVLQKDGLFNGLNSINDNLILLNRKNSRNLAGEISGTEHSGKTFQNKREIFNALISTNDKVSIVTFGDDYDGFVKELGGNIVTDLYVNPFEIIQHYGLANSDKYSKAIMLEALFESLTRSKERIVSSAMSKTLADVEGDDEEEKRIEGIAKNVETLISADEAGLISFRDPKSVIEYIYNSKDMFEAISDAVPALRAMIEHKSVVDESKRLQLIKIKETDLIPVLDFLFIKGIRDKQQNSSGWVFVDHIDSLFESEQTAAFLTDYVEKTNTLQNIFTAVIQSAVKIFTDSAMMYRAEDFINQVGYHKLLNQGAIERREFSKLLNIPNSLVNYITSAELGKGCLFTSASNMAFNDNFTEETGDSGFYNLFKL